MLCVRGFIHTLIRLPKTKLSGLKTSPKGPDLMESMVPGSKSTRTALGTYFPDAPSLK